MVDSILTNQAPSVVKIADNRSVASAAVANASNVPEMEVDDEIIDVTPRTMDTSPEKSFSSRGAPELKPPLENFLADPIELRPALENFNPIELTSERALENRVADLEIVSNNEIDEISTMSKINNGSIEAFRDNEQMLQQSVDLTA